MAQLTVTYATRSAPLVALRNLSFTAAAGEFVALVGPSGCGKSSLLRAVGGLLQPQSGTICLGDMCPQQARRSRCISFVFQQAVLLPWSTVRQNVALPLWIAGVSRHQRAEAVTHFLDLVGLSQFADFYPHQLSGGMQQRVALARAFVSKPSVLLLDEPFSALDEIMREHMNVELSRLWSATGATVLFVTHALGEAVFLADRVLVLSDRPGTVVADVPVHFPRPRTLDLLEQASFLHHVASLRHVLRTGQRGERRQ